MVLALGHGFASGLAPLVCVTLPWMGMHILAWLAKMESLFRLGWGGYRDALLPSSLDCFDSSLAWLAFFILVCTAPLLAWHARPVWWLECW